MALDFASILSAIDTGTPLVQALAPIVADAVKRDPEAVRARVNARIFDRQTDEVRHNMAELGRVMQRMRRKPDNVALQLRARGLIADIVATAKAADMDVDLTGVDVP